MLNIKEQLIDIFDANGVIIFEDEYNFPLEMDSIQLISIVVQIEDRFQILIPEDMMLSMAFFSFSDFEHMISKLVD